MNEEPTLETIEKAMEEIAYLMEATEGDHLEALSAMYAKAYTIKLRLMAKETKHADR